MRYHDLRDFLLEEIERQEKEHQEGRLYGLYVVCKEYDARHGRLYINKTQYFSPVPQDVWEFHIGGYQVPDKYLKSRKGRALSLE